MICVDSDRLKSTPIIRAREGDTDAAFKEDEIHPDDKPDDVEDPVDHGLAHPGCQEWIAGWHIRVVT